MGSLNLIIRAVFVSNYMESFCQILDFQKLTTIDPPFDTKQSFEGNKQISNVKINFEQNFLQSFNF